MSNTRSRMSGGMPMPSSFTDRTTRAPSRRTASAMWPPSSVNLAALLSRFEMICVNRAPSPQIGSGSAGTSIARS